MPTLQVNHVRPKYDIGETVYYIHVPDQRMIIQTVNKIAIDSKECKYSLANGVTIIEEKLYNDRYKAICALVKLIQGNLNLKVTKLKQ